MECIEREVQCEGKTSNQDSSLAREVLSSSSSYSELYCLVLLLYLCIAKN